MGGSCASRPLRRPEKAPVDQVIELATLLNTFDTLLPTVPMAAMAATEISEAMSTYSMAVAPRSFFIRRRKMDSISISKKRRCSIKAKLWSAAPAGFWGSEGVEDKRPARRAHTSHNG